MWACEVRFAVQLIRCASRFRQQLVIECEQPIENKRVNDSLLEMASNVATKCLYMKERLACEWYQPLGLIYGQPSRMSCALLLFGCSFRQVNQTYPEPIKCRYRSIGYYLGRVSNAPASIIFWVRGCQELLQYLRQHGRRNGVYMITAVVRRMC